MSKDRIEAFSDGVFAIILTLLVLELRVPNIAAHSSLSQYAAAMVPLIPKIVSFVLSFGMIANYWIGHHYYFRQVRQATLGLAWLNNLFLLWLCFVPFPTAMLGDHPTDQFPVLLYGVDSLLIALSFFALRSYTIHANLFKAGPASRSLGPQHTIPALALFAISILFAFINVYVSLICFFLVPLLYFVPNLIGSKILRPD